MTALLSMVGYLLDIKNIIHEILQCNMDKDVESVLHIFHWPMPGGEPAILD